MPDAPTFTVDVPRRCHGHRKDRGGAVCGELAAWMLKSQHGGDAQFFCDTCRQPGVEPIDVAEPYRRVSLFLEVLVCGASQVPAVAHREALDRMSAAVAKAGGVLSLMDLTSGVARFTGQAPPARKPAGKEGR